MKIKVTKEHIDKGVKGSWDCCPIALAIKEQLNIESIEVNDELISTQERDYRTPLSCVNFMEKFDEGDPVTPFEFEL